MDDFSLLIDLHKDAERQGPGSDAMTDKALRLAGLNQQTPLEILDIGCGTGASALVLAGNLDAHITAVDFLPDFLEVLETRARETGVADKITTVCCSMDELPFAEGQFDVIWSEGAIYNIGFAKGVSAWRRFLKPGGLLAASEITWLTAERPQELQYYWNNAYPEIDTASAKIGVLEQSGYLPLGYFPLPGACWLEHYYTPMQSRFEDFLARHGHSEDAAAVVEEEKNEIELYRKFRAFYSYGFYLARKIS